MIVLFLMHANITYTMLFSSATPTKMEYVDKILANCEAVKVAVLNVFEGFTQAQETAEEAGEWRISFSHQKH